MVGYDSGVRGVGVHVVAVRGLSRTAVATTVMSNHAISVLEEEHHLRVPVIGTERPAVVEHDRLAIAPILVIKFRTILGCDEGHFTDSSLEFCRIAKP